MKRTCAVKLLSVSLICVAGCTSDDNNTSSPTVPSETPPSSTTTAENQTPATLPVPPFTLAAPKKPASQHDDIDLATADSRLLGAIALQFSSGGEYNTAVQYQYWSVTNGDGHTGAYNLACFYSLANELDASLYWLQHAAINEGVDSDWAGEDTDLGNLRNDPRWGKASSFLQQCNDYWLVSDLSETKLIVPRGYNPENSIAVAVGLHGMGSRAHSFVDDDFQEWADELNIAFVGVSGTDRKSVV